MSKHGEPWRDCDGIVNHMIEDWGGRIVSQHWDSVPERDRAVACVNACAGIEDPAEAIREAREALMEAADVLYPNAEQSRALNLCIAALRLFPYYELDDA